MVERRTAPLTPEEEAALIVYRDQTMARGLATGPVNRPEAEQIIRDVYTAAEQVAPKMVVWADSPMGGVHLAGVLNAFFDNEQTCKDAMAEAKRANSNVSESDQQLAAFDAFIDKFKTIYPDAGKVTYQDVALALNRSALRYIETIQS